LIRKNTDLTRVLPTFTLSFTENAVRKIPLVGCTFYYRRIKKDESQGKKGLLFIYYESTKEKIKDKIYMWVSVL
jgi:hypothetical protein